MHVTVPVALHLPRLPQGELWKYHYNQTGVGRGGAWVSMETPVTEFPLFQRVQEGGQGP